MRKFVVFYNYYSISIFFLPLEWSAHTAWLGRPSGPLIVNYYGFGGRPFQWAGPARPAAFFKQVEHPCLQVLDLPSSVPPHRMLFLELSNPSWATTGPVLGAVFETAVADAIWAASWTMMFLFPFCRELHDVDLATLCFG